MREKGKETVKIKEEEKSRENPFFMPYDQDCLSDVIRNVT